MKKELFFDRFCGQQFAGLLEDGKIAEFFAEEEPRGDAVGNIYKGKVTNVLAGMNACFVSCGFSKNAYLSLDENYEDYAKYDGKTESGRKKLNLSVGDEIIVQAVQPPRGNKGAKVTTHLSFVGKFCIYLPGTDFMGVSRKITDESEREGLLDSMAKLRKSEGEGFIARTSAPFATPKQLKAESEYLRKVYAQMLEKAKTATEGALLYEEADLPTRMLRDTFGEDVSSIHVGDEEMYQRIENLIRLRGDIPLRKLVKYTGKSSLFQEYGIMPLVYEATRPIAYLEGGAYLVFDHTEAMTVIDVNSGGYVGKTNLEDTVYEVNMAAAKEIARQVRLRNVGGIVVVDFIDMVNEEHKLAVTKELERCLAKDKAKCKVLPMSEFCLTQFTRKRLGSEALSFLIKPCPHCEGNGHVHDDIFVVTRIRDSLLSCFAKGYTSAIVDINESVMRKILENGMLSVEAKGRWRDKRVYFIPHRTYKEEYYTLRGENAEVLHLPDNAQILY